MAPISPASSNVDRANNFDFLRLVAASCVLVSHQFALTGRPEPMPVPFHSLGGLGVLVFFVASGFLVGRSWIDDPHVLRFAARRVLRIWPGWIAVTMISILLLGPAVTTLPLADYFRSGETWAYLRQLVLSETYRLPGVFEHNPLPSAVNGSLWTLPLEVQCYGLMGLAGLATLLRRRWMVLALLCAAAIYAFGFSAVETKRDFALEFSLFFGMGVCLQLFQSEWTGWPALFLAAACAGALLLWFVGQQYAALFVVLPLLVVQFGSASWPVIGRAGRFGDFSYGLYIYAFPVQQTLVWLTDNRLPFGGGLAVSFGLTLLLAVLSWYLVERPMLRMKPSARQPFRAVPASA